MCLAYFIGDGFDHLMFHDSRKKDLDVEKEVESPKV